MKAPNTRWLPVATLAFLLVAGPAVAPSFGSPDHAFTGILQSIEEAPAGDLFFLEGGLQQGFQTGMLLEAFQNGTPVAELIVVGCQPQSSAALLLKINSEAVLKIGDRIRVKTRKSPLFS